MQETEIRPFYKMVYDKLKSVLENEMHKIVWDFEIQMHNLIPARRPDLVIINKKKKKRICQIRVFTVLAPNKVKSKKTKKEERTWTLLEY